VSEKTGREKGQVLRVTNFQILRFCVIMNGMEVIVRCVSSAFKHGITEANIRHAMKCRDAFLPLLKNRRD
jgi:hypothetical protein